MQSRSKECWLGNTTPLESRTLSQWEGKVCRVKDVELLRSDFYRNAIFPSD